MSTCRNVFACLVHERRECVIDLVRNLHHLDPSSLILLYNGGQDAGLLTGFPFERYNAVVHPSPRPMKWGWLHDFALDCFRFALAHHPFDTMTIVDSDQLALRPGWSERLGHSLASHPRAGLLGDPQTPQHPGRKADPAIQALKEIDRWRPFLRRFPEGESKFVHWTFWPSTVFTAEAARDLVKLWEDPELQGILRHTRIWASEEVLFPTLVALLGYDVLPSPGRYDVVKYRVRYSTAQLDVAMGNPDLFWVHPIPRRYDDPLRSHIRNRLRDYPALESTVDDPHPGPLPEGEGTRLSAPQEPAPRLLLTWPILAEMRRIEGWLSDEEADLLIAAASRALASSSHAVIEVGSFCGKATVILGRVAEALGTQARIHAIDPGDGLVGSRDGDLKRLGPTRAKLEHNLRVAGLLSRVQVHPHRSTEVPWSAPIGFLLVDGLHDYASVSADFLHFEPWVVEGGFIAFHDFADYFPGVKLFVQEVLRSGRFRRVHCAGSLLVLQKVASAPVSVTPVATVAPVASVAPVAPVAAVAPVVPARPDAGSQPGATAPLVSCIMPTFNRRRFVPLAVRTFLAQDWSARELVIVDDGSEPIADLLPEDPRIRYVRLDRRHSIGAKRNLACQAARGEVIVHWDDDDWSSPQRLTYQVSSLLQARADVCGLSRLYYHQPGSGRSWRYVYPDGQRPWVSGNTLCYRKDFWSRHPFPDLNVGEDARFLWSNPSRRLLALDDSSFFVALIHSANIDPKRVHHRFWHAHPTEALRALMGEAFEAYRRAATGESAPGLPRAAGGS